MTRPVYVPHTQRHGSQDIPVLQLETAIDRYFAVEAAIREDLQARQAAHKAQAAAAGARIDRFLEETSRG